MLRQAQHDPEQPIRRYENYKETGGIKATGLWCNLPKDLYPCFLFEIQEIMNNKK